MKLKYMEIHSYIKNWQLMIKSELFQLNKLQILNSKKQYLLEYAKQIENSIASTWESNQTLKT